MNERLAAVRTRRALLQERAAHQRDDIARLVQAAMPPVTAAEWGLRALRLIRSKPVLVAGALAAAAILRPGRAARWSIRAWAAWQAWQRIRGGPEGKS
ncbi:MAG: YqjK-like family protein [Burkholderiales bacterium]|nr:YqjK-like family protein [Burkholderiales bacterium]